MRGNNTTISIAHRLSTIKRSDLVIVIGADGQVEETGPYSELSKNPDGAFSKLMEWQMNGGDEASTKAQDPKPTETEEIEVDLEMDEADVHDLEEEERRKER